MKTAPRTRAQRDFCYVCHKAAPLCICGEIVPVDNRTKIVIAQHKCERTHHIGTVRIASLGLRNAEIRVVWPDRQNRYRFEPGEMVKPALLYPGPGAADLAAVPPEERPRDLVLLDGTWRDVRKLYRHNPWLGELPRYRLDPAAPSRYRIRKEPNRQSISTIEAIVHALRILEPDTPGIHTLTDAFETMIDRQIDQIRSRPAGPATVRTSRRRNRPSRSLPDELKGPLKDLVIAAGESVPWRGRKRALIRWFAFRVTDGALFDQFVDPREGAAITDDHLDLMGLCRQDLGKAVKRDVFAGLWNEFIGTGNTLVAWNKSVLDLLGDLVGNRQRSCFLKAAWCNTRGGRCGHLKDLIRAHDIPLPAMPLKGRASRYLSETVAVTYYLNRQSASSSTAPQVGADQR